jgi:cellulose synthase/poly-beta-1,6-N-acetylglucosamine synthase-like glycosyltransferase
VALFILAALLTIGYTYFGYPLLVALLARARRERPRLDPGWTPTVSVLIPVYNAARYLPEKLRSLRELDYPAERVELLVYSDGSDDGSAEVAEEIAASDPRVRVLRAPRRLGKPAALNEMMRIARGEVFLLTDIRQPLVPGALRALVERLADPGVGCVSGNLVLQGDTGAGLYWRYENWIRRQEGRFRSMLGVTGPIYAIRARDMVPLPPEVILDDMWIPMRLRLAGRRIVFAEGAVAYDEAFGDEREFGRKVRTLAGNFQLLLLLPALLNPLRNPSFFEFFSHKLLRLACPFVLVSLLVASALAAGAGEGWAAGLLLGQAAFYLAALFPRLAGRVGGVARSFVVMNAAAVVGLVRCVSGTQRVTW